MDDEPIGSVRQYLPQEHAAAMELRGMNLQVGDRIRIKGPQHDFVQTVKSIQVEHLPRIVARPGEPVAVAVREPVEPEDQVFLVRDWHSPKE